MPVAEKLRRWEVFSHCSDAQLGRLAACLSGARYPAGTRVVEHGADTRDAYVVDRGRIAILRPTSYGPFRFATLGPGDVFGETSFVDGGGRTGDAVAEEDCELFALSPVAFSALTEGDTKVELALYWAFWKSLSGKLRRTNERLARFFSEPGVAEAVRRDAAGPPPARGDFRVELGDKRKLFEEQRLSNLEINFLTSLSRELELAPSEVVFREGEEGDAMYVVLRGRVMISKLIAGAGEEALAFLERGDYFGEMALIDRVPRSADAQAGEEGAVVLAIPRDVLAGILDIGKPSSLRLLKLLCSLVARRLRELDEKIVGWFMLAGGDHGPGGEA